ncbi:PREDICTED: UPF0568 protein C14orf166 homolog [Nicrophorus vespilloides]|uniref:UPF0568 protein C14orf166 homolog n=1 Tax=Nicrophorus vespilloides TaxID=110193 RepID=A0ABM1MNZ8_NICVS|nr:PREDICTED: UPF0568 protein C14orf166 homolog [Nicrophorus vespilloides]
MSLKRKLTAIGYEGTINCDDENDFCKIIIWLERNRIKFYSNEDKKALDNVNASNWSTFYDKYAKDLECPMERNPPEACLDWYLGYAIKLEYIKNKNVYDKHSFENEKVENAPKVVPDNPLDALDFTSREFQEGVQKLANILKIPPHPSPLIMLEACTKIIQTRLNPKAIENPSEYIITGTPYPYKDMSLGFELKDREVDEAAKVLRLLFIQDQRDLQTKVNECIVAVQSITANPKTDTRLGKVGK